MTAHSGVDFGDGNGAAGEGVARAKVRLEKTADFSAGVEGVDYDTGIEQDDHRLALRSRSLCSLRRIFETHAAAPRLSSG